MPPTSNTHRLQVWIDPVCPWCFIGFSRLQAVRREAAHPGLSVEWKPFQLQPNLPVAGVERGPFFARVFGSAERADQAWERVRRAGAAEGVLLDFGRIAREPNTLDAHRLIRWAARRGSAEAVIEAMFEGYFQRGLDIGDTGVLASLAEQAGLPAADAATHLQSDADADETQAEAARGRALGIRGVPAYALDGAPLAVGGKADLTAALAGSK